MPTTLVDYEINVSQSNVSNVDPEKKFDDMLALQRDAATQAAAVGKSNLFISNAQVGMNPLSERALTFRLPS